MGNNFKSDNQRKAVMAKLNNGSNTNSTLKGNRLHVKGKPKPQKLSSTKDSDGDGVVDSKDCEPFNPKKQGFIHDVSVKLLKKREELVERSHEREQRKLNDLKDKLRVSKVNSKIENAQIKKKTIILKEIARERNLTKKLKNANKKAKADLFKTTKTGRAVGAIKKGSKETLAETQKFLQKKSTQKASKKAFGSVVNYFKSLQGSSSTPKRRKTKKKKTKTKTKTKSKKKKTRSKPKSRSFTVSF